jgi:Hint module
MCAPDVYCIPLLQVRLTDNHILYVADVPGQSFADRAALPAAGARAGQYVWVAGATSGASGAAADAAPSRITGVRRVADVGLVNPFTLRGELPPVDTSNDDSLSDGSSDPGAGNVQPFLHQCAPMQLPHSQLTSDAAIQCCEAAGCEPQFTHTTLS